MRPYVEGEKLAKDEFVLKVRPIDEGSTEAPAGFMAKLTKKHELQKSFVNWNGGYWGNEKELPVFVVKETYKSGWKLLDSRKGMSQNWAIMVHPNGYTVEIYLDDFLDIAQTHTIIKGEIQGLFKWESKRLYSPEDD